MLASTSAKHQHVWQKEPPGGELFSDRAPEEKHGDELDKAHNTFWTRLEELQRLRLRLEEDPEFGNSSDWPMVVEWCSTCAITREVRLVLPEEEMEVFEVEKSGRGSRTRRMLAFQLMLTAKRGYS